MFNIFSYNKFRSRRLDLKKCLKKTGMRYELTGVYFSNYKRSLGEVKE